MNATKLVDRYNRHLTYLRISITDRCNLRCLYCQPDGIVPKLPHAEILSYEEIMRIVRVGVRLGIRKIRVTGGEPLVRKGAGGFLAALTAMEELQDVSLTTNGVLLASHLSALKAAGIRRINISLDTLKREKFAYISGYDFFDRVWQGIEAAYDMGFHPIKLNVVVLKGINDDELLDLARLSFRYPFHVRFIEYMPIGKTHMSSDEHLLAPQIKKRLQVLGPLMPLEKESMDGPAERYRFKGAAGEVGLIRPISHHFCAQCNRLRLTANGRLRPCLLADDSQDLKTPLRRGAGDRELAEAFLNAVRRKMQAPFFGTAAGSLGRDPMSGIGG